MQQMCELSQGVWIVYLTCLSLIDIRTRKIPIWLLGAGGVMAIVMQIWKSLKGTSISPILIVSGAAVGIELVRLRERHSVMEMELLS